MEKYEITRKLAFLRSKKGDYLSILHYNSNYSPSFKEHIRQLLEEVEKAIQYNMYVLTNYDFYNQKWRKKEDEKIFSCKELYR